MKLNFTKTFLATIGLGVLSLEQVHADQLVLSCKETLGNSTYLFEVYEGGFDDKLSLKEITVDGQVISSIMVPATGGSFVGCGTRTSTCNMIQSTQYSSNGPNIIFTMLGTPDSKKGHGTLNMYENGFGEEAEATKTIEFDCQKKQLYVTKGEL
ncbi:MAG TPA: hypothetical protein VIG33_12160 [Pseudobdellovibrionaceae bacterium]